MKNSILVPLEPIGGGVSKVIMRDIKENWCKTYLSSNLYKKCLLRFSRYNAPVHREGPRDPKFGQLHQKNMNFGTYAWEGVIYNMNENVIREVDSGAPGTAWGAVHFENHYEEYRRKFIQNLFSHAIDQVKMLPLFLKLKSISEITHAKLLYRENPLRRMN